MKHPIILCAIAIASIFTSCSLFGSGEEEEKVVKITPMFAAKVQLYSYLSSFSEGYAVVGREVADSISPQNFVYTYIDIEGNEIPQCHYEDAKDFSEGLAAVRKDGKYGFINTKGEVVIPFNYSDADCFGDSLAAVCKDGKWGYINREGIEIISIPKNEDEYVETLLTPFSEGIAFTIKPQGWAGFEYYAIDKTGKKLFTGTIGGWCSEEGGRFQREYLPKFSNGEVYVPSEDYDTYDVYNKQGQKLRAEKGKQNNNYEDTYLIDTIGISLIFHKGLKEIRTDSTDTTPLGNIPTIYNEIYEIKNGVALVCLYKYYEDPNTYGDLVGEGGYAEKIYYGYADLDGNDTFSQEVKDLCKQSLDNAKSKYADYNSEQNNPTWLNGTWRSASHEGYTYWIFDNGKLTTYYECYPNVQEEYYSICEGRIMIEDNDGSITLDCDRDIVITEDGCEWTKISDLTTIDSSLQGASMSTDNYSYSNSYSNSSYSDEIPSWLDGNWRYRATYYGITQEVRVGISGSTIVVLMNGEHYYTGDFYIDDDALYYNSRNGSSDYLIIDRANRCLMVDNRNRMERF